MLELLLMSGQLLFGAEFVVARKADESRSTVVMSADVEDEMTRMEKRLAAMVARETPLLRPSHFAPTALLLPSQ